MELKGKISSLFDVPEHKLPPAGSSIVSFSCDPHHEEYGRPVKKIYYENTYQLEPPRKFRADKIKPVIDELLTKNLEGRKYDPVECSILAKTLSDELKSKVKELNFLRYKFVCVVTIGQNIEQGVRIGSRYLWDPDRDNYAASSYHNKHLYAVGAVYALYFE